jgi:hypothetical protein
MPAIRVIRRLLQLDDVEGQPQAGDSLVWDGDAFTPTPLAGDQHYVHTQSTPSAVWTIDHGLGKHPSVTIVDSGGTQWQAEVQHVSQNRLIARFSNPFGGVAYLN